MSLTLTSRLVSIAAFALGWWFLGGDTSASDTSYDTPEAAVEAVLEVLLSDWNVVGECDPDVTPVPKSVCYYGPSDQGGYRFYGADAFMVTDTGWWIGVAEVDGSWKPYGAGRCDLFYCRRTAPDGELLFGHPNGDVNCDGTANSVDALLILQVVADLLRGGELRCWESANVYQGERVGGGSVNALAILQSETGLIGALPMIDFRVKS